LDLGFAVGATLPDSALQSETVGYDRLVMIMPQAHRLAGREAVRLPDLANEPFLVTESGCVYRRIFDEAFETAGAPRPPIAGEFGSLAAILRMVEAGLGCALLPSLAISQISAGIDIRPWCGDGQSVPIVMTWRSRRIRIRRCACSWIWRGIAAPKRGGAPLRCAAPSQ
jgi:DNA-binding transcriptional LysR family regulator